jgi:hypothetical protein
MMLCISKLIVFCKSTIQLINYCGSVLYFLESQIALVKAMALLYSLTVIFVLQTQLTHYVDAEIGLLRFMVLGDWGGLPWPMFNYSTAIERGVADGMARLANEKPQDFVIALGKIFVC